MAYYYVDDTGTATADAGRFATAQTGAFTNATSYASVYDVFAGAVPTTAPVSGDIIMLAHNSVESWATNKVLGITDGVILISASATARETYLKGAIIQTTAGGDLTLLASINYIGFYSEGVNFYSNDRLYLGSVEGCHATISDGAVQLTTSSSSDFITIGLSTASRDGTLINFDGVDITTAMKTAGGAIRVGGGSTCHLHNISIDGRLFTDSSGFGGAIIRITDSDLSAHNTSSPMINWTLTSDDSLHLTVSRCKIPSGFEFVNTSILFHNIKADIYSCDTGDGYHYFEHQRFEGKALESTTVYRTLGATYNSINHFSAEVQTNSNVIPYSQPLKYKLAEIEIDLTTSKTLTAHIIQQDGSFFPANLTDHECWIEVTYPDTIDNALGKTVSSQTTGILETPVVLSLSNQAWTGTSGNVTKQLASVVVPASIIKAPVTVYLCIAKDITVADGNGASTIEMFACPKLEIS